MLELLTLVSFLDAALGIFAPIDFLPDIFRVLLEMADLGLPPSLVLHSWCLAFLPYLLF